MLSEHYFIVYMHLMHDRRSNAQHNATLLLSPLGSVKSKLIVLQDCIEWVCKSSCWAGLRLPGSLPVSSYWRWAIEFRALEVAWWEKPSVGSWQLCHCEVMERAVQSPNPIRAWFGTSSITGEESHWAGWLPGQAFAPSLSSETADECVHFCHLGYQKYPLLSCNG